MEEKNHSEKYPDSQVIYTDPVSDRIIEQYSQSPETLIMNRIPNKPLISRMLKNK